MAWLPLQIALSIQETGYGNIRHLAYKKSRNVYKLKALFLYGLECNLFIKQNRQNWMYTEALAGTA
jgi:hypothetical protein